MADLLTAAASCEQAVTGVTHDDRDWAWLRWKQWCESTGLTDFYLDQFSQTEQNLLLGAFAVALQE